MQNTSMWEMHRALLNIIGKVCFEAVYLWWLEKGIMDVFPTGSMGITNFSKVYNYYIILCLILLLLNLNTFDYHIIWYYKFEWYHICIK